MRSKLLSFESAVLISRKHVYFFGVGELPAEAWGRQAISEAGFFQISMRAARSLGLTCPRFPPPPPPQPLAVSSGNRGGIPCWCATPPLRATT